MRRRRQCRTTALLRGARRKEIAPPHRVEVVKVAAVATIELPEPSTMPGYHPVHLAPVGCIIGALQEAACARVFAEERSSLRS